MGIPQQKVESHLKALSLVLLAVLLALGTGLQWLPLMLGMVWGQVESRLLLLFFPHQVLVVVLLVRLMSVLVLVLPLFGAHQEMRSGWHSARLQQGAWTPAPVSVQRLVMSVLEQHWMMAVTEKHQMMAVSEQHLVTSVLEQY